MVVCGLKISPYYEKNIPSTIGRTDTFLAYLTSYDKNEEREFSAEPVLRAWKGYDFSTLDSLHAQQLIEKNKHAKSLFITQLGVEKAQKLITRFFGETE